MITCNNCWVDRDCRNCQHKSVEDVELKHTKVMCDKAWKLFLVMSSLIIILGILL